MASIPSDLNRAAWDKLTPIHAASNFYDVKAFLDGKSSLCKLERSLVGCCQGKNLLHLQCHFGLDSLSWARMGAMVTGVDFSPVAIEMARSLSGTSGIGARFQCGDVQELAFDSQFDIAVTTYGVLCWLGRLREWATGIHRALRPGGRLVVVEFHPILEALHPGKMTGARSYFGCPEPSVAHTIGTYADRTAAVEYQEFRWQHSTADVVSSLIHAGFTITEFEEYPYCSFGLFDELTEIEHSVWAPADAAVWPYMFSLEAKKGS